MSWFEDAYFLFSVRLFDASRSRSEANPKKIYGIDHALIASVSSGVLPNAGRMLENLVFTALRRCHPEIYYYRTKGGREVDFVVPMAAAPERGRSTRRPHRALFQVCETLADPRRASAR